MAERKIYIAADHRGFHLKEKIDRWLSKHEIPFEDLGNNTLDPNDDYPDFAVPLAKRVAKEKTFGIVLCGSAQGVCIASNKVRGARAVIPHSLKEARSARNDEDANIICLSGDYHHWHLTKMLLQRFLTTPFSGEDRHKRRLDKIAKAERSR